MGKLIRFPLERRQAQAAAQQDPEYVQDPGFFGVRIRPGINATVVFGAWQECYADVEADRKDTT